MNRVISTGSIIVDLTVSVSAVPLPGGDVEQMLSGLRDVDAHRIPGSEIGETGEPYHEGGRP